jgi:hypothetical protein
MIPELLGATQSVQALASLLKSANGLSNYNEILLAVTEVNTKLMNANAVALASQEQQSLLAKQLRDREAELEALILWKKDAEMLEQVEVAKGVFAYMKKDRRGPFQSQPKYCANCYFSNRPSLLQESREDYRNTGLNCHLCDAKMVFNFYKSEIAA